MPTALRWTPQQLLEYKQRQIRAQATNDRKPPAPAEPAKRKGVLMLTVGLTPTGNKLLRMHFTNRRRMLTELALELMKQVDYTIPYPLVRAKVEITRYSAKEPDKDGLYGSVKPILDALQVAGKRHPYGIGVLQDDDEKHITLDVKWARCPAKQGKVVIEITPL